MPGTSFGKPIARGATRDERAFDLKEWEVTLAPDRDTIERIEKLEADTALGQHPNRQFSRGRR